MRGILVIAIDCLRADHLSCYGYRRETTPTLDSLAERGVRWLRAYSPSSWTKPSVASIFTGKPPTEHGMFHGVKRRASSNAAHTDVLPDDQATIAQVLSDHGWRCGAFINNFQLGPYTHLNRGFDPYDASAGKADVILDRLARWLNAESGRPFFGYLHFLEAHWPYKPRRRHVALFDGDRDTNRYRDFSARDYGKLRRSVSKGQHRLDDAELREMIQMYDGAVRRLDGKVKLLLAMLKELGIDKTTDLIITADHGEEFLDHGRIGHGQSLHRELTHVPLIHRPADHSASGAAGRTIDEPVSLTALAGTIKTLACVTDKRINPGFLRSADPGAPQALGRTSGVQESEAAAFSELMVSRRYSQALRTRDWTLIRSFDLSGANGALDDMTDTREMCDTSAAATSIEFYDAQNDPDERDNLAGSDDAPVRSARAAMTERLDAWWRSLDAPARMNGSAKSADTEIDDVVVRRLEALGYLE